MSEESASFAIRARWIYPVDRRPLEGGVITIAGGRIVAVGQNTSGQPPRDLGDVAILPGLINAHTHLEFSLFDRPLGQPGNSFSSWLAEMIAWRRAAAAEHRETDYQRRAIERGLAESYAAGVAAVGEIATGDWRKATATLTHPIEVVAFAELLGLAPDRVEPLVAAGLQHICDGQLPAANFRPGLSPHAPYTVHPELLEKACELSAGHRVPVAMHLAESAEELELLASQHGPLVDLLRSIGAWDSTSFAIGKRPLDYLQHLTKAHRALVVHGNYLGRDEIAFLAARRRTMSVVYCPRTHAYFGHRPYPLAAMLAAGVRVAVGTDSRASNPDLNLFSELGHIFQHHPTVPPDEVLRLGTLAGAEALGLAADFGSITVGKRACFASVACPADGPPSAESLLGRGSLQASFF